jgi:hypothetical protein
MKTFRNLAFVVASFALAAAASATGIGGVVVVGGAAGGYAGSVVGSASSISNGNAIAATQINGYGSSFQHTDGIAQGSASIGGAVSPLGASVVTGTTQIAQVNSYGNVTGNAPIEVAGGMIANGTGGLGNTTNYAQGNAQFGTAGIGGFAVLGGLGVIGSF